MSFTISDCLSLASFDKARVLAGEVNLNASVKAVSVLESTKASDIKKVTAGVDQLILSTFFEGVKDSETQVNVIKALSKAGNIGLVLFHTGGTAKEIPQEVIATAEDLDFPIITMAKNSKTSMGVAIREITERMLWGDKEGRSEELINNTIVHLLNFEKYTSFQTALKAAALANDFQLILMSEDLNPIFSVETRYRATIGDAIKLGKARSMKKQTQVFTQIDVYGVVTYWGPVRIKGEQYYMFIVDNEEQYTAADITKLAAVIELAMGMWKYSPERDVRAEFLMALRRGNAIQAYHLQDEVKIDPEKVMGVFYVQELEEAGSEKLLDAIDDEPSLELVYISEDSETYGLILADPDDVDAIGKAQAIYNSCKGSKEMTLFHITGLTDLDGAAEAFALIGETQPYAKNVFPMKSVFTKFEMAMISNCLGLQEAGGLVKKYYLEFFEPFDKLGDNKRQQLMETLEVFVLDAGMNNAKTAKYLDIHTNTVQYRLRKIDDLLGAEITGNRVIPGMTIALALLRLERVVTK